ncbi:MAG: aldo/keto reductase [Spirochaetales bacterium]
MIPKSVFGRTGHLSSRTIFGAAALGSVTQDEADRTLEVLLKFGVNHIDTAASYGDSELRLGPWMARHRQDFFLATKTDQRTYQAAKEQIHRSLDRLKVANVDLIQLHYLVDPDEWKTALSPNGALEAVVEAREQGLTRFVGVTGHDWTVAAMHLRSFERFDFDTVLLPYSHILMQKTQYLSEAGEVFALAKARNIAVQTIKSLVRRPWTGSAHFASTWYEPLVEQTDIDLAVHWVLGNPDVFLNTIGDIHVLPKVLSAASRYTVRPDEASMAALIARQEMVPLFDR